MPLIYMKDYLNLGHLDTLELQPQIEQNNQFNTER